MNQSVRNFTTLRWRPMLFVLLIAAAFISNYRDHHRFDNIKQVSVGEAKTLVDGGALVVDVRGPESFHTSHIPGAINIPLTILESGIPASIASAISKPVVVYCGDGVTSGPEGTQILNKAGYKQAVNIKTGMEGWAKAGLSVQK